MLGWNIGIYRQADGGESPATAITDKGIRLAVWQTGHSGLDWISELVKAGKAINLGGNGYPYRYTAMAEHLIPRIIDEPPEARRLWAYDKDDILTEKWEGRTRIDRTEAMACRQREWLLIEAWDES